MNMQEHKNLQKLVAEGSIIIMLLNLQDKDASPRYAYFAIQASKAADFLKKNANKPTDLEKYGVIIKQGNGLYPSDEDRTWFKENYGLDS